MEFGGVFITERLAGEFVRASEHVDKMAGTEVARRTFGSDADKAKAKDALKVLADAVVSDPSRAFRRSVRLLIGDMAERPEENVSNLGKRLEKAVRRAKKARKAAGVK